MLVRVRNRVERKDLACIPAKTREGLRGKRASSGLGGEFTTDHIMGVHELSIQFGVLGLRPTSSYEGTRIE